MGSRAELVAALRDALPTTIRVLDAPKVPDKPGAGITALIVVERASVDPGPSLGTYSEEHHLHVLSPSTDPARIDDGLDDALDDLLEALLPLPWIAFRRAVRSTFADTFHSYDVTTTVTTSSTTDTPTTSKE